MWMSRTLLGTTGRTIFLGLAVVAIIFAINYRYPTALGGAELIAGDLRMDTRRKAQPTGSVVVVAIDDESISKIGQWPWPRGIIAQLISALGDYKVGVIGVDLLFPEVDRADRDHRALAARLAAAGVGQSAIAAALGPNNDRALADALLSQGSTYLAYPFEAHFVRTPETSPMLRAFSPSIVNPPPVTYSSVLYPPGPLPDLISANSYLPPTPVLLESARGSAFVDVDLDADGDLRSIPTVIRFDNQFCVPLFLALVSAYRDHARLVLSLSNSAVERVAVGTTRVLVDEMGRMLIDFRGRLGRIPTFSANRVLARGVPEAALKGKIVLVGVTAFGLGDRIVTPLGANIPGVEIQAAAVDNVLAGKFIRYSETTQAETWLLALFLGLAVTIAASTLSALGAGITSLALVFGYILYAQHRLYGDGVMIGVILPLVTVVVTDAVLVGYRYTTEGSEKRRLRRAFVHYLAPTLVDQLAENSAELKLGGEERTITVMFADLTGFTTASTHMRPEALTGKVNRYFEYIVQPIDATGGYVERFLGDAALAFWGAPLSAPRHPINAIRAAFQIIDGVKRAREEDEAGGDQGFTIKVGINTGPAVVGNIGSKDRYSYTAMGEDVNLASRLEGVPPLYGCLIVVGERTAEGARNEFLMRELDWILAKGATKPMTVFQPIAPLSAATDAQRDLVAGFAVALEHYRARRFAEACRIWEELTARFEPAPSPSSIMAERARHFISEPPPTAWDAVFVLTSK
jgi:adenylate cyclase